MPTSIPIGISEKFATFGDLLRYLRRAAGLTQLELSIQVGYSHAQISRLEQNLRLPDIPMIEARFVPALGLENQPQLVDRLLELAATVRREDAPGLGICPYKGLNYFDDADADLFVGREALTAKLTERVLSLASSGSMHETRFLAVVGASGSGKSSLVRAGVIPSLRWEKRSADWQIHILTPTSHPLESLANTLTVESESVTATSTLMDDLARDSRSLHLFVKRQWGNGTRQLLVIDQFEELFTLCRSEEERASFIGNLLTASSEGNSPVFVMITLRADFYAQCADYIQLREVLAVNQEYIGAMNDEELRRAIEEPARRGHWELEPGLTDLLLHDVGHEPGALPLLSHALFEVWQRRRGRTMTLSGYTSSGGVRGAIAETAETVFADQFSSEQKSIARRIFLRLTELNDGAITADTRRRAKISELILKPEDAALTQTVLNALADARLITVHADTVEVAHEALIREWHKLRGWLEENREGLRLHRQLTEAAQQWQGMDNEQELLLRGARLAQIREWASQHQDEINKSEREFLTASVERWEREAEERESQRQRELEMTRKLAESEKQRAEQQTDSAKRLRKRAVYLTGAFIAALIMALAALFFGRQAQTASRLVMSRELAAASINNLDVDPERSILLALDALDSGYTVEAEEALHQAVQDSHVMRVVQAYDPGAPAMIVISPDEKQIVTAAADGFVKIWDSITGKQLSRFDGYYAAYSPDGKQMAIVTAEGIVRLIDPATGKEIYHSGQIDATKSVAFSPDGSQLVTVTSNNTPKVWSVKTGMELSAFTGHTDYVGNAVFSPDGKQILTASDDGTARIWNVRTGEQMLSLSDHSGWVWNARYSPNGKMVATVSGNDANIWDADSGKRLYTLIGHTNDIYTVAFSPDGTRLATGGADRKIKVWDTLTGEKLFTLSGHAGAIFGLTFNLDGTQLLSTSDDGTFRIWEIAPSHELLTLPAKGSSGQIAFSRDGNLLAATDEKGSIKVWDAHSGKDLMVMTDSGAKILDLAFNSDGTRIFSANGTKLKMLDVVAGREVASVSAQSGNLNGIAISQDGKYLVTAGDDYSAKIWDISSSAIPNKTTFTLKHSSSVFSVAFDTSGTRLATGAQDGIVRIWDVTTGREAKVLRGHKDLVSAVAFSLDGSRVASSSWDGTARVWDAATGRVLFILQGHTDAVTAVAYSPDGKRVATVSRDGVAKLWDPSTGEELLTFPGDGSALSDVAFSPDGTRLATGGVNGTRVYLLSMQDLIALAKTRVTRSLTSEECQKYLHLDASKCSPITLIPTTPIPPSENPRVCQITTVAGVYDDSFNETTFNGVQQSAVKFGWDVRVLQSASTIDYEKNLDAFIKGDCDLIVGLQQMADAIQSAAESNPRQKFMISDVAYDPPLKNVWTQLYAVDQASFLAGYTAASVTKTGRVGIFGGLDIPQVTDFMDGFVLGVAYYNERNKTNIEVLGWNVKKHEGLFVGGFCCAAEGRQATEQLVDQGADIILPVAGSGVGLGALYAAKLHGNVFIIGVDTDWAKSNPEYANIILTSVLKNYDVSVIQTTQAITDGTFIGGIHVGILETDEVGLAPFYETKTLISPELKVDLEGITKDIVAGKIKTKP